MGWQVLFIWRPLRPPKNPNLRVETDRLQYGARRCPHDSSKEIGGGGEDQEWAALAIPVFEKSSQNAEIHNFFRI